MKSLIAGLVVVVSLCTLQAFASLGGDAASIDTDRAQMKASSQSKQANLYTVHRLITPSGTVVREYLSSAGNVFAVAWQGQFVPDMQQLLGSYFEQYSAAVKADKESYVGRRPLNLQLPGLVVQMNGYVRNYHFRAYLPQQVPAGVKQEELW
jgi:hypothetical protein